MVIQFIYVFIELLLTRQEICTVNLIKRIFMSNPYTTTLITHLYSYKLYFHAGYYSKFTSVRV